MIAALALLACAPVQQVDLIIDWSRQYGTTNNFFEPVTSVVPLDDGGAIVTGAGSVTVTGPTITRLDAEGDTVWETVLAAPNPIYVIGADSDGAGGAVLMATRFGPGSCFAFRCDASGALVWSTAISASTVGALAGVTFHDAVGDGAGGIVGVGHEFIVGVGLTATIFHVDANGNEVARLTPAGPPVTDYFAIDRASNGDYGVAGTDRIALFDSNLDLIWRRDTGFGPLTGLARNVGFGGAGGMYVGFNNALPLNARIVRLDRADGSVLWVALLASNEDRSEALDYAPAEGGGVWVCGEAKSGPGAKGVIQRFSPTGESDPARTFGEDTSSNNRVRFDGLKRLGDGLLAFGYAIDENFVPPSQPERAGLVLALLPEFGATYCGPAVPNSTGLPASITAHGDSRAASSGLVLRAQGLPPGTTTLFIVGSEQGSTPILGNGQGTICLAGQLGRYASQIGFARPDGVSEVIVDPAATPTPAGPVAITAGQTWNFQCWYRDNNPAATSNATDAVSITFD